jgi:hypothetical protein
MRCRGAGHNCCPAQFRSQVSRGANRVPVSREPTAVTALTVRRGWPGSSTVTRFRSGDQPAPTAATVSPGSAGFTARGGARASAGASSARAGELPSDPRAACEPTGHRQRPSDRSPGGDSEQDRTRLGTRHTTTSRKATPDATASRRAALDTTAPPPSRAGNDSTPAERCGTRQHRAMRYGTRQHPSGPGHDSTPAAWRRSAAAPGETTAVGGHIPQRGTSPRPHPARRHRPPAAPGGTTPAAGRIR